MKLHSRLDALERKSGAGLTHCVRWSPGLVFDNVLAQSRTTADASKRMLIEIVPIAMDRNPVPLTTDELAEQTKAHAWADRTCNAINRQTIAGAGRRTAKPIRTYVG